MIAEITHHGQQFRVDLSKPIDLSVPLAAGEGHMRAWYVDPVTMEPVRAGDKVFSIKDGAPVNFRNILFNPHGHGTHTESVGHISPDIEPVGNLLKRYFFIAQLITVRPEERRAPDGKVDTVITLEQLRGAIDDKPPEAVVLRTTATAAMKSTRNWSGTNATYLQSTATAWLRSIGVRHLLVDLPSVDREEDGGTLAAHHAFWDFPNTIDLTRTISEMIVVPDEARDGRYLLELQLPHFINDAAPSRPVLYAML